MAHKMSSEAVISYTYFSGEDGLPDVCFEGSDDELEMEDDSEPDFQPLDVDQG